jgi:AGCS family alanine or glycine:cation symporter
MKRTAKFYCLLVIFGALTVGNLVQMNSMAIPLTSAGVSPYITGLVMCFLVAIVILGGLHRFSAVVSWVIPFMAIGYIGTCLVIVLLNLEHLIPAFSLIFQSAFHPTSVAGGVLGFTVLEGVKVGFDRGLFATDVGIGIDSIVHSSVESQSSVKKTALSQALISTLSPLIVMLVCTLTGLVLLMTGAFTAEGLQSTDLCIEAFRRGLNSQWAGHIITITLFFFAYTTILTWSFCSDKAIEYLFSTKMIRPFQIFFVLFIPLGAFFHVNLVWTVADIFMNLLLVINIIALAGLYKEVAGLFENGKKKLKLLLQT